MSLGRTSSKSSQALNPNNDALLGNTGRAEGIANTPATPYGGSLDLSASRGALSGLTGYNAQQVDAGSVGADEINLFMNPYTSQVIDSFLGDSLRGEQQSLQLSAAAAEKAGAFGGGRHGVSDALTREAALRSRDGTTSGLRAQGFDTALGAAFTEAARKLQAAMANQTADLGAAGVRAGAATSLGALDQAEQMFDYNEFLRQQQDPLVKQQLLNQAYGLLYSGPLSSSSSSGWNFSLPKAPSIPGLGG